MILLVRRFNRDMNVGLVFDASDPESFVYATELQKQLPQGMKVLYIANKSDKNKVNLLHRIDTQEYETTELCKTAASFLNECGLELPLLTNMTVKDRLFPVLFDCAVYPLVYRFGVIFRDICVPKCETLQVRKSSVFWRFTAFAMILGLSIYYDG